MHPFLNIATQAARRAGDIIARHADRVDSLTIDSKGHNDFVSEVDHAAEEAIVEIIRKHYPDHSILAEERGDLQGKDKDHVWIIDPLDGTTNFLHGFPQFAVSIAVEVHGVLEHAVVYDPMRQEMFSASRGGGAKVNDRRIRVGAMRSLEGCLIGTGFPFRDFDYLDTYMDMFRAIVTETSGIRRPGSAALDLAYVAAGRLDGFWEIGLKPWDIAAGALIIKEAGGIVTDFASGPNFLDSGDVMAGNLKVHAALDKTLRPYTRQLLNRV